MSKVDKSEQNDVNIVKYHQKQLFYRTFLTFWSRKHEIKPARWPFEEHSFEHNLAESSYF